LIKSQKITLALPRYGLLSNTKAKKEFDFSVKHPSIQAYRKHSSGICRKNGCDRFVSVPA
jgi:hypothetical protein